MFTNTAILILSLIAAGETTTQPTAQATPPEETRVYRVRQTTRVEQVPENAKSVRWWVSIPDDDRFQDVLDLTVVSAPGPWQVGRDPERGNRFLYIDVSSPKKPVLETVVEFTLRRSPVLVEVDPSKVGPITDTHRLLFANEVSKDAPHMEVNPTVTEMANKVCGNEKNVAKQAMLMLDAVASKADHYSKDPSKPKCGIGDAGECIKNEGGCCTDLHSLFIAMARSRGIPARLQMGYRLLAKNEGKEVDPGYRCWAEYFLPGYGWVPADIVEADAVDGLGPKRWFTGLTERRLWLNEGREFILTPRQAGERVNTMIMGYAEIDGVPARVLPEGELTPQLTRAVHFVEVKPESM
jgi:transglutaminase-like putative cysteine protease